MNRIRLTWLTLLLLSNGCAPADVAWPERVCPGEHPPRDAATAETVTFPPRDFVCADDEPTPCALVEPLHDDDQRSVEVTRELDGATFVYLLDRLSLPEAGRYDDGRPMAVGLDLDGLDSGDGSGSSDPTCEEWVEDYQSPFEVVPGGIDNAFQSLVGAIEGLLDPADCPGRITAGCLNRLLAEDVAEGDLLLLLELTAVDSFEHDPEVEVALHLGRTLDGAAPTRGERIEEGQTFETVRTLVAPTRGDLLHGRVRVRWPEVVLPRARFGYPETLLDAELRAEVCEHGLFHGVLAGGASVDALVAQTAEQMPGIEDTARGLLESVSDLRPSAADRRICERISVGYAIEGIPAQRNP